MGQPYIQVRANRLGKIRGRDPHYHLLIVVDDGNGNRTYYRGGHRQEVLAVLVLEELPASLAVT
jgi:hypothetical protein